MVSAIDSSKPVYGTPTTQSVRDNFYIAQSEITALQNATTGSPFLPVGGGTMQGPLYLRGDPVQLSEPVTLNYFLAHAGSGGGGTGGGIPEAPVDNASYGRMNAGWTRVLAYSGEVIDGGNF